MKIRIITILFLIGILTGCSSHKNFSQRQSYMMPQKSDLPRNTKYTSPKAKKTYKVKKNKVKKTKKYFAQ